MALDSTLVFVFVFVLTLLLTGCPLAGSFPDRRVFEYISIYQERTLERQEGRRRPLCRFPSTGGGGQGGCTSLPGYAGKVRFVVKEGR